MVEWLLSALNLKVKIVLILCLKKVDSYLKPLFSKSFFPAIAFVHHSLKIQVKSRTGSKIWFTITNCVYNLIFFQKLLSHITLQDSQTRKYLLPDTFQLKVSIIFSSFNFDDMTTRVTNFLLKLDTTLFFNEIEKKNFFIIFHRLRKNGNLLMSVESSQLNKL